MNLNTLPQDLQQAVVDLTEDEQFQKIFKEDEQLDYLESLEHDKQIEFHQLQLMLRKKLNIFGLEFNPLTIALYSYLYSIQSPIVFDIKKSTLIDLDVFFYLLQTKDFNWNMKQVLSKSVGYTKNVLHLDEKQIVKVFEQIYRIEFRCLNLFPKTDQQKKPLFNVDWITSITGKVKPLTSYTTEQIYKDISITEVYYYFANYCRQQGDQRIFIRTEDEILAEEDKRMCQLIVERLVKKGVIKPEQSDSILKQISQENE